MTNPEKSKKYCSCGFPQSSPRPHEHSNPEKSERELKSAEVWIKFLKIKCEILDPDGWDRHAGKWENTWGEEITKQEFFSRMDSSTCIHRGGDKKFCSCMLARPELVEEFKRLQSLDAMKSEVK